MSFPDLKSSNDFPFDFESNSFGPCCSTGAPNSNWEAAQVFMIFQKSHQGN